MATNLDTKNRP